jgi:hypothetical protein
MNRQTNSPRRQQTNQSSLRTAINRRIRWGTTSASGQKRAMILSFFALGLILAWMLMGMAIQECDDSLVMEIANRSSIELSVQCLIFNKKCNCRISPNETLFLNRCLPRLQLFAMHIIPVISCVLELFVFRELITLGTYGNRFSKQVTWVMFPLVSISIAIAMFSTHCYHLHLGLSIFITSCLLAMLVFHDCTENRMVAENERRRRNRNRWAPLLQPIDENVKYW